MQLCFSNIGERSTNEDMQMLAEAILGLFPEEKLVNKDVKNRDNNHEWADFTFTVTLPPFSTYSVIRCLLPADCVGYLCTVPEHLILPVYNPVKVYNRSTWKSPCVSA